MQRMPAKTKTLVAAGAVLVAVIVGVFALMSNRNDEAAPLTDDPAAVLDQGDPATDAVAGTGTDTETTATMGGEPLTPSTDTGASATIPETHRVAEGDTLYQIARTYYNDPLYADDIAELNPELSNPDFLPVGMELKLPPLESAVSENAATDPAAESAADSATDAGNAADPTDSDMPEDQTAE